MSFWDNVKKFAQPYADDEEYDDDYEDADEYSDEEQPEEAPAHRSRRTESRSSFGSAASAADTSASVSSPATSTVSAGFTGSVLGGSGSGKQEVVLFRPNSFNDTSKAADDLRRKKAVVVNMENVDKALTRRVVDFLSGCAYALDGKVKKIAQSTYLFCPYNMEVVGDLENVQSEVESYV